MAGNADLLVVELEDAMLTVGATVADLAVVDLGYAVLEVASGGPAFAVTAVGSCLDFSGCCGCLGLTANLLR